MEYDTIKNLSDKLSHSILEIRERAIQSISHKLNIGLISSQDIATKAPTIIGKILAWINQRQTLCTEEIMRDALNIVLFLSNVKEGQTLLIKYGAIDFLSGFNETFPKYESVVAQIIKSLTSSAPFEQTKKPLLQNKNIVNTDNEKTIKPQEKVKEVDVTFKEEKHNYQDYCDLPQVYINEMDQQLLYDLSIQLRYGNEEKLILWEKILRFQVLHSFPLEAILHRPEILKAIQHRCANEKLFNSFEVLYKPLFIIMKKAKSLFDLNFSPKTRPSVSGENKIDEWVNASTPTLMMPQWKSVSSVDNNKAYVESFSHIKCMVVMGEIIVNHLNTNMNDVHCLGMHMWTELLSVVSSCYEWSNITAEFIHPLLKVYENIIKAGMPSKVVVKSLIYFASMIPDEIKAKLLGTYKTIYYLFKDTIFKSHFGSNSRLQCINIIKGLDGSINEIYNMSLQKLKSIKSIEEYISHLDQSNRKAIQNQIEFDQTIRVYAAYSSASIYIQGFPLANLFLEIVLYSYGLNQIEKQSRIEDIQGYTLEILANQSQENKLCFIKAIV